MKFNREYFKPYLFILLFLMVPLIIFQIIKSISINEKYEDNRIITSDIYHQDSIETINGNDSVFAIAIHGGAGNIPINSLKPEKEAEYRAKLFEALQLGIKLLKRNDSAIYVVESVIKVLEDSPLFNAGKGAVFTNTGINELDASIMDGRDKNAGAVAGVTTIKNPISAALAVMQKSEHVMLSGHGAELFSKKYGLEMVDRSYFYTDKRWNSLQNAKKKDQIKKYGTVGCVVLDRYGNLAAGTSTGGMTNKKYGRIGDSPIIGAGTYADNETCAISATGHGEFFIRFNVAADISARMKYNKQSLHDASKVVINELKTVKGFGGVICVDKDGNISMVFNTSGMFRASSYNGNDIKVRIFNNQSE